MTTFTLHNARGMRVVIDAHDAGLRAWWAPDRYGRMADVLAAAAPQAPSLTGWHGGMPDEGSLLLHLSHDGLSVRLLYRLGDNGSLHLDCEATASAGSRFQLPVPMFNLRGRQTGVGDHVLRLAAGSYRPAGGSQGRPQEAPCDVAGSAFDFRQPAPLGARLGWPALAGMGGFNHDFFLADGGGLLEAACVAEPASGRVLHFASSQNGLRLRSDAGGFSCAMQPLELLPGASARLALAYRLGVRDMEDFDISEPISMTLNK